MSLWVSLWVSEWVSEWVSGWPTHQNTTTGAESHSSVGGAGGCDGVFSFLRLIVFLLLLLIHCLVCWLGLF